MCTELAKIGADARGTADGLAIRKAGSRAAG